MTTNPNLDEGHLETMGRELATLRAQAQETEALLAFLRDRTIVLNNGIRSREGLIADLRAELTDRAGQVRDLERTCRDLRGALNLPENQMED